jgi:hypothetical protein
MEVAGYAVWWEREVMGVSKMAWIWLEMLGSWALSSLSWSVMRSALSLKAWVVIFGPSTRKPLLAALLQPDISGRRCLAEGYRQYRTRPSRLRLTFLQLAWLIQFADRELVPCRGYVGILTALVQLGYKKRFLHLRRLRNRSPRRRGAAVVSEQCERKKQQAERGEVEVLEAEVLAKWLPFQSHPALPSRPCRNHHQSQARRVMEQARWEPAA